MLWFACCGVLSLLFDACCCLLLCAVAAVVCCLLVFVVLASLLCAVWRCCSLFVGYWLLFVVGCLLCVVC